MIRANATAEQNPGVLKRAMSGTGQSNNMAGQGAQFP